MVTGNLPLPKFFPTILQGLGTIVIMETCGLSSRQRVATTGCDVLPAPGIVG